MRRVHRLDHVNQVRGVASQPSLALHGNAHGIGMRGRGRKAKRVSDSVQSVLVSGGDSDPQSHQTHTHGARDFDPPPHVGDLSLQVVGVDDRVVVSQGDARNPEGFRAAELQDALKCSGFGRRQGPVAQLHPAESEVRRAGQERDDVHRTHDQRVVTARD